jgi:GST-like protein
MFGQVGYFKRFDGKQIEDKRPLEHYAAEAKRLLDLMEERLASRTWIMGDEFTIADVSLLGMVRNFINYYEAGDMVNYDQLTHVPAWLARGLARPAVQRGLTIPAKADRIRDS